MDRMPKALKISLFAVAALAGLLLLAAFAVLIFVDADAYKPRVEAAMSKAFGMTVTIEGKMGVRFIPLLNVSLTNVRIINQGTELAFVKEGSIDIELLPLLQREIRYGNISTNGTRLSITRDRDGRYNYQRPQGANQSFHELALPKISFADLVVSYTDKQSAHSVESGSCNGELTDLRHPGGAPLMKGLSLAGKFACAELRSKNTVLSDLKFSVAATDGVYDFKPVTMLAFGGQGSGTMRIDRSGELPAYQIVYALSKFRIEEFYKAQSSGKSVSGQMDFSTTLSMQGRARREMRQSAHGEMSLSGTNLSLVGVDLDNQLVKFESSQNLNLFDVSALLFAGPVGLAVTKGYDFSGLGEKNSGSTQIRTVVSKWKVEKGVAHAKDVALATNENRLAIHGGLDFVDDSYQDVTVALIDANGCAKARQKISGPFSKPIVDRSNILVPIGPLLKLLDKAKTLLSGAAGNCEVFYSGAVASPR